MAASVGSSDRAPGPIVRDLAQLVELMTGSHWSRLENGNSSK